MIFLITAGRECRLGSFSPCEEGYRCREEAAIEIFPSVLPQLFSNIKIGKVISVTGREDPQGCETSKLLHFLDNW
jgi:hypothetical protein